MAGFTLGPVPGGLPLERFWWGSVFLLDVPGAVAASSPRRHRAARSR
ncbi:hypothetical protein ACLQ2R_36610 [Streptosporangium sp. DT93]